MLRWSLKLFRIRGIQLSIHWSFLILLVILWDGWRTDGWIGLAWSVAILVGIFTCVVLHELGHSLTAQRLGVGVPRILLLPIGGMAEFDRIPRRPRDELLITAAGPAVNFVIAPLIALFVGLPEGWSFWHFQDYPATATGYFQLLLHWNLWMGCFNLLPAFPMDGGRILRALLATRLPYIRATFWAVSVGKLLAGAGVLLALFHFAAPLVAVLFGFILLAGEAEYRLVLRREADLAQLRDFYARRASSLEEPPLLVPDRDRLSDQPD